MITDNYLGTGELTEILSICKSLTAAWNEMNESAFVSTDFMQDKDGFFKTVRVYDSNGEVLGYVGFTDAGDFGFYPDNGDGEISE